MAATTGNAGVIPEGSRIKSVRPTEKRTGRRCVNENCLQAGEALHALVAVKIGPAVIKKAMGFMALNANTRGSKRVP
jgi:hypothetical protein